MKVGGVSEAGNSQGGLRKVDFQPGLEELEEDFDDSAREERKSIEMKLNSSPVLKSQKSSSVFCIHFVIAGTPFYPFTRREAEVQRVTVCSKSHSESLMKSRVLT